MSSINRWVNGYNSMPLRSHICLCPARTDYPIQYLVSGIQVMNQHLAFVRALRRSLNFPIGLNTRVVHASVIIALLFGTLRTSNGELVSSIGQKGQEHYETYFNAIDVYDSMLGRNVAELNSMGHGPNLPGGCHRCK